MFKKLLLVALSAASVSPAFALLNVTDITTILQGSAKAGAVSNSYSSTLNTGSDYQVTGSASGAIGASADGYASALQSGDSAFGYSYAQSSSSVNGIGTASAWAVTYTRMSFTLSESALITYAVWANGAASGQTQNRASVTFAYDGTTGGDALPSVLMGDSLSGTVVLTAGSYVVELYNSSKTTAKSTSAASSAYSLAYGESSFEFTAEAVPEPGTMAVFALGGLALLRRRKKA